MEGRCGSEPRYLGSIPSPASNLNCLSYSDACGRYSSYFLPRLVSRPRLSQSPFVFFPIALWRGCRSWWWLQSPIFRISNLSPFSENQSGFFFFKGNRRRLSELTLCIGWEHIRSLRSLGTETNFRKLLLLSREKRFPLRLAFRKNLGEIQK